MYTRLPAPSINSESQALFFSIGIDPGPRNFLITSSMEAQFFVSQIVPKSFGISWWTCEWRCCRAFRTSLRMEAMASSGRPSWKASSWKKLHSDIDFFLVDPSHWNQRGSRHSCIPIEITAGVTMTCLASSKLRPYRSLTKKIYCEDICTWDMVSMP